MPISIKQARKLLGKLAHDVSDIELEKEIKAAELLKALYFTYPSSDNKPNNGKA